MLEQGLSQGSVSASESVNLVVRKIVFRLGTLPRAVTLGRRRVLRISNALGNSLANQGNLSYIFQVSSLDFRGKVVELVVIGNEVVGGLGHRVLKRLSFSMISLAPLAQYEKYHQNQDYDDASKRSHQSKHKRKWA